MEEKKNEENLDEILKYLIKIDRKMNQIEKLNKEVIKVAVTNYGLIEAVFKQNDISLKNIKNKTSSSLKYAYICIIIILLLIGMSIGSILKFHFFS